MQTERRQNPYPLTWEIPAAIFVTGALLLVLGVHLGRGIANWTAGAGWHWPSPAGLFSTVPAVLAGDASIGLASPIPDAAAPSQVLGWVLAVEAIILIGAITLTLVGLRRWGPGRLKGMATAAEAEAALGISRLRRVRAIIRPDLHPAHAQPPSTSVRIHQETDHD
jgi:hypothetical protein